VIKIKIGPKIFFGLLAYFVVLTILSNVNHNFSPLIMHLLSAVIGLITLSALLVFEYKKDVKKHLEENIILDTNEKIENKSEEENNEESIQKAGEDQEQNLLSQ